MRKLAIALVIGCFLVVGMAVPTVGAATPVNPKVVIIVGPVGGSTSSYKSDADNAAAEARKYTTNVVKVYTPKATWSAAKAALQGASIVVYMGHGNGWPSPYPPFQEDTKDGLGLNPTAGTDNTSTRYYGANYLATYVDLAPNAVVFLGHLCYSAGNSEPGLADVSLSDAKKRVDNMAAGWIKSGARAVVAEPYTSGLYGGAAWWIRQLFTTRRSIEDVWLSSPSFNDHVITFGSSRSSGFTAKMDPGHVNAPPYKRSMVAKLTLQTLDVTGARYAVTDTNPSTFVVPGAAAARIGGAPLYADPSMGPAPATTLAPDTRVRLDAISPPVNNAPVYAVHTLDGATSGYVYAASLIPRDSQSPSVWTVDTGTGAFSPNGDGSQDTVDVAGQLSESATWHVDFTAADGTVLDTVSGTGNVFDATWDGLVVGGAVADGTYRYVVRATDGWGNPEGSRSGTVRVDTVAPELDPVPLAAGTPLTFSPNGDGYADTTSFSYATNEAGHIDLTIRNASGTAVRRSSTDTAAGAGTVTWAGDKDAGGTTTDGSYEVALAPRDLAGNRGGARTTTVVVYTALRAVKASSSVFFPQDGDSISKTVALTFVLTKAATVTWTVTDTQGATVATRYEAVDLPAGTYNWSWSGRTATGAFVPRGRYYSTVTATDGTATISQRASTVADAFRIVSSDATPGRGQTLTVTAYSAESLSKNPTLSVYQPGRSTLTVTMSRIATGKYSVTIRLSSSGSTGTLRLRVVGYDAAGHAQGSSIYLPLH